MPTDPAYLAAIQACTAMLQDPRLRDLCLLHGLTWLCAPLLGAEAPGISALSLALGSLLTLLPAAALGLCCSTLTQGPFAASALAVTTWVTAHLGGALLGLGRLPELLSLPYARFADLASGLPPAPTAPGAWAALAVWIVLPAALALTVFGRKDLA